MDLYLIHRPLGDYYSFWRAMEQVLAEGLTRAIGVSNFYPDRLVDLIGHNEVTPMINQIETHPFQRHPDHELMRTHGVQMEAWRGFADGRNNLFTDADPLRTSPAGSTSPSSKWSSGGSSSGTSSSSQNRSAGNEWSRTLMSSTSP